ncbi:MAG TPA: serine/threonine-protein kinase [Planctomycetaceae bacterium]|nr:serine/threonine-protein kinase [Planctomycetaceae bacterium]
MVSDTPNPAADAETVPCETRSVSVRQFLDGLAEAGLLSEAEVRTLLADPSSSLKTGDGDVATTLAIQLVQTGKITPFQARAAYQGRAAGLRLGEYEIVDLIDQGGMGLVLKARHRRLKRWAAIKIPYYRGNDADEIFARFRREADAGANLRHENIVVTYDAGDEQGVPFLAMEYVEGWNLAEFVKEKGPLSPAETVYCLIYAARGLAYLHRKSMFHRDIKPKNLMLTISLEASESKKVIVKVLDLGLVRILNETIAGKHATATRPGQIMGTPEYMSPEQADETHGVDHRADIYALGCTMYYLLAGRPPYIAKSAMDVIAAHKNAPIPSIRAAHQDVSAELELVFQRTLAKDPADRPQSMDELIIALESTCAPSQPIVETPLTTIPSTRELEHLLSSPLLFDLSRHFLISKQVSGDHPQARVANRYRLARSWLRGPIGVIIFVATIALAIVLAILRPSGRWFSLGNNSVSDAARPAETLTKLRTFTESERPEGPLTHEQPLMQQMLFQKGRNLSPEAARRLQKGADADPENLQSRLQLIGYYWAESFRSPDARRAHEKLSLWLIENYPELPVAGAVEAQIDSSSEEYLRAKSLWLNHVKDHNTNPQVLGNAARFFCLSDFSIAEDLLLKAKRFEPKNPAWSNQQGRLYQLYVGKAIGKERLELASKSLEQFEREMNQKADIASADHLFNNLAVMAFEAGADDKAEKYAIRLLQIGRDGERNWNFGNAIHDGNRVLGRLALRSGDVQKAKLYLLESGKTPGSPQLNSFGPDMTLAKELLEKGEAATVLEYFELCRKFWRKDDLIDKWVATVNDGKIPDFPANLL